MRVHRPVATVLSSGFVVLDTPMNGGHIAAAPGPVPGDESEIDMEPSRPALRAAALALAFAALGCASATDRFLSVETWPPGASVRLGVDGRAAGQTPLDKLHVQVPKERSLILIVEKDSYQTIAYPVTAASPEHLFFSLQRAPDNEALLQAVKELQSSVSAISAAVSQIQSNLDKRGGN